MLINFNTIEEKIFSQKKIQKQMPEFQHIFSQWNQSIRSPVFNDIRQKSKLQLLSLLDNNHIKILENYYNENIYLKELNYRVSSDVSCDVEDLKDLLMNYNGFVDNISLTRNKNQIKISFWR